MTVFLRSPTPRKIDEKVCLVVDSRPMDDIGEGAEARDVKQEPPPQATLPKDQSSEPKKKVLACETIVVILLLWLPIFLGSIAVRFFDATMTNPFDHNFGVVVSASFYFGGVVLLLFLPWRNREPYRDFGFPRPKPIREFFFAFLVLLVAVFATFAFTMIAAELGYRHEELPRIREDRSGIYRLIIPAYILLAAVFEEVLFRGYLWRRIEQLTGSPWPALFATSFFFAIYHPYDLLGTLAILVFGMVMGLFYWQGRSLPRLILAHAAFNLWLYYISR